MEELNDEVAKVGSWSQGCHGFNVLNALKLLAYPPWNWGGYHFHLDSTQRMSVGLGSDIGAFHMLALFRLIFSRLLWFFSIASFPQLGSFELVNIVSVTLSDSAVSCPYLCLLTCTCSLTHRVGATQSALSPLFIY